MGTQVVRWLYVCEDNDDAAEMAFRKTPTEHQPLKF